MEWGILQLPDPPWNPETMKVLVHVRPRQVPLCTAQARRYRRAQQLPRGAQRAQSLQVLQAVVSLTVIIILCYAILCLYLHYDPFPIAKHNTRGISITIDLPTRAGQKFKKRARVCFSAGTWRKCPKAITIRPAIRKQ